MTLMRKLWLTVVITTVVAFSGSLSISIWSARGYLVQQLERKNSDNANSLALAMTQQQKDPVNIDLQVSALFDTGFYQEISVTDPFGKVISERTQDKTEANVPAWFVRLFPIPSRPGWAQVTEGWKQYANVKVVSHNQFAYQALWEQMLRLLLWFGIGGSVVGLLGTPALRTIGRSLGDVVQQATAIGERRFITIAEPRIPELRALAKAMNGMVERVRQMFNEEATRLEELQHKLNYDPLTGLPNRACFMAHFHEELSGAESAHTGVLAVLRVPDLNVINATLGRAFTDAVLQDISKLFQARAARSEDAFTGRIKSGDVALMLPGISDTTLVAKNLAGLLDSQLVRKWAVLPELYNLGVSRYERGEKLIDVLSRVDHALALAEAQPGNGWHAVEDGSLEKVIPGEQWRFLLTAAVAGGKLQLVYYPVIRQGGEAVHQEGVIRLQAEPGGKLMTAADFMPIAAHLNLTAPIDLAVIRMAIDHLSTIKDDVAVNLAGETLGNWTFRNDLSDLLRSYPELCPRLWFEVPQYGAFKHFEAFRELCRTLKELGCHVGVEYFGQRLSESEKLIELGLDYIKLHPSLVQGISINLGNQEFVKRFCHVAHNVGIIVIAVGVRTEEDLAELKTLGVDAATGPIVNK
jgi:EAL domain-containing protein (putative c-di-GMP-specific phosphodiesterase class I)/GGDEF domain-containing protein